jgi:tetratricopeptide (TPR) repeat protein
MMQTYNHLGVVELKEGRLAEARAWHEKSAQLAVHLRDSFSLGHAVQNVGIVCQREGEVARERGDERAARLSFYAALRFLEEGLQIRQSLDNKADEAASLYQLARIHLRLGDLAAAEQYAHAARQIDEFFMVKDAWLVYDTLSEIAAARGDTAAAAEWAEMRDAKLAEVERLASGRSSVPG